MSDVHVFMQLDNTTAVSYINNMGGIKSVSCNELAQSLWEWCILRNIWVSAQYLPGVENTVADAKSRTFNDNLEWMLDRGVFSELCSQYGRPDIDLFASRLNAQIHKYVAWLPEPESFATDAFTLDWSKFFFYAFPPFCLVGRCLQKIELDKADGFIIVPIWPTQIWFAKLLSLLIEEPIVLPKSKYLLMQPVSQLHHPLHSKLCLMSCRLSGDHLKRQAFYQRLLMSSAQPGARQLENSMTHTCGGGWSFVLNNMKILCKHL